MVIHPQYSFSVYIHSISIFTYSHLFSLILTNHFHFIYLFSLLHFHFHFFIFIFTSSFWELFTYCVWYANYIFTLIWILSDTTPIKLASSCMRRAGCVKHHSPQLRNSSYDTRAAGLLKGAPNGEDLSSMVAKRKKVEDYDGPVKKRRQLCSAAVGRWMYKLCRERRSLWQARKKYNCIHVGCTNQVVRRRLHQAWSKGYSQKMQPRGMHYNFAHRGGVCLRHGAKLPTCSMYDAPTLPSWKVESAGGIVQRGGLRKHAAIRAAPIMPKREASVRSMGPIKLVKNAADEGCTNWRV